MHHNQWNPNVDTMKLNQSSYVPKCLALAQFCLAIVFCVAVIVFEGIAISISVEHQQNLITFQAVSPFRFLSCFLICVAAIFDLLSVWLTQNKCNLVSRFVFLTCAAICLSIYFCFMLTVVINWTVISLPLLMVTPNNIEGRYEAAALFDWVQLVICLTLGNIQHFQ